MMTTLATMTVMVMVYGAGENNCMGMMMIMMMMTTTMVVAVIDMLTTMMVVVIESDIYALLNFECPFDSCFFLLRSDNPL